MASSPGVPGAEPARRPMIEKGDHAIVYCLTKPKFAHRQTEQQNESKRSFCSKRTASGLKVAKKQLSLSHEHSRGSQRAEWAHTDCLCRLGQKQIKHQQSDMYSWDDG